MQQEISVAADAAGRKYSETTPEKERSEVGIANAMRMGAKEKASKLYMKMMKLVAVANPANGPEFLEEVIHFPYIILNGIIIYCVHFCMKLTRLNSLGGEALQ